MKIKLKTKHESVVKHGIIYLGENREGVPILIQVKTRGILDKRKIEAEAKVFETFKIPHKEKNVAAMSETEKKLFQMRSENDQKVKMVITYDETNPKVLEVKNQVETYILAINVASYFDMDDKVEDTEGKEITNWDRWDIKVHELFYVVEHLINEDTGLGLSLNELAIINEEIKRVKQGQKTIGEALLEDESEDDEAKDELEKAKVVLNEQETE